MKQADLRPDQFHVPEEYLQQFAAAVGEHDPNTRQETNRSHSFSEVSAQTLGEQAIAETRTDLHALVTPVHESNLRGSAETGRATPESLTDDVMADRAHIYSQWIAYYRGAANN